MEARAAVVRERRILIEVWGSRVVRCFGYATR